jgi:hypothetical protein
MRGGDKADAAETAAAGLDHRPQHLLNRRPQRQIGVADDARADLRLAIGSGRSRSGLPYSKPAVIAILFKPASTAVALQRNTEMVWSDPHSEFPSEVIENLLGGGAFAMCLHGPQCGIAQGHSLCGARSPIQRLRSAQILSPDAAADRLEAAVPCSRQRFHFR